MHWGRLARARIACGLAHASAFGIGWVAWSSDAIADDAATLRGSSDADHEAACAQDPGACFTLLGVSVDGVSAFSQAELADAYQPYLARTVNLNDLARIADAITSRYRQAGYFLSRAVAPPQDAASGVARILVLEGRIAEIIIEGDGREQASVFLRGLDAQPIANLSDLDRRLALANDVPGLNVRAHIEPDPDHPTLHRLVVNAALRTTEGYAALDNRGGEDAGPLQAFGRVRGNSMLLARDQISLGVFTTPASPRDFTYAEAGYAYVFKDGAGAAVALSTSRAHDGHDMASPEIGGDSLSLAIRLEQPLRRGRSHGLWLGGAFDLSHLENDWASGGGYAEELRVARVSLRGFLDETGRASTLFARASFGLDILGASGRSFARRSRSDASGEFITFNLHASHYRDLGRYMGVYAALDGQWADRPLLLSEEFSIGGQPYGRAYAPGEISGDHGVAGLIEFRAGYDPDLDLISFMQGYLFYDAAQVWSESAAPGADELSLASAGAGLRISVEDWLTARVEFARPLTRTPAQQDDKDWRSFFSLSAAY